MARLYVQFKVADYPKFRVVFDEQTTTRTKFGCSDQSVFHVAGDANDVVVLTGWPSVEKARAYTQSPELKQAMQNAGVTSQPTVLLLEEA